MIEAAARTPAVSGSTGKRCRVIAQDEMMTTSNGEPPSRRNGRAHTPENAGRERGMRVRPETRGWICGTDPVSTK